MKISQPKVFLSKQDSMQPKVVIFKQDRANVKIHVAKGVTKVVLSKKEWMQPSVKLFKKDRANVKIHVEKGVTKVVLSKKDWMQPSVKLVKKDGENVKIHITKAVSKVVLDKLDCTQSSRKLSQQDQANHLIRQGEVTNGISGIISESEMDVGSESMIERDITKTKIVSSILEDLLEKVNNSTSTKQIENKNIENRPNYEQIDLEDMFYSFDSDGHSSDDEFFTPNTSIKEGERDEGYDFEDIDMFETVSDQHEEQNDFEDKIKLTKISMMGKEETTAPSILLIPPVGSVHRHQISNGISEETSDSFAGSNYRNMRRESIEMGEGSSARLASRGPAIQDEQSDKVSEGSIVVSPGRGKGKRVSNEVGWGFFYE